VAGSWLRAWRRRLRKPSHVVAAFAADAKTAAFMQLQSAAGAICVMYRLPIWFVVLQWLYFQPMLCLRVEVAMPRDYVERGRGVVWAFSRPPEIVSIRMTNTEQVVIICLGYCLTPSRPDGIWCLCQKTLRLNRLHFIRLELAYVSSWENSAPFELCERSTDNQVVFLSEMRTVERLLDLLHYLQVCR
jgi:hypothetical protein